MNVFSLRQLIAHLTVFAKFSDPRSLYLESSLSELYNQVVLCNSLYEHIPTKCPPHFMILCYGLTVGFQWIYRLIMSNRHKTVQINEVR